MFEETAASLPELIEKTRKIARRWVPSTKDPQELWFRGQPKARFQLSPGLYRPETQELNYDELFLFERFKSLATPYLRRIPSNDWEWYFLAQHYGLPTRLLDWTEGLLPAAYFAMCDSIFARRRVDIDAEIDLGRKEPIFDKDSPTVWILDGGTLNNSLHGEDILFVPSIDGELGAYLPQGITDNRGSVNRNPMALLPLKANDRITAQQGMFTVHGHETAPLDDVATSRSRSINLARILLDRANLAHLWEELQFAGVNRLTLFPDVDSVALHVKWIMQAVSPNGEGGPMTKKRNPKKGGKKKGAKKAAKKR